MQCYLHIGTEKTGTTTLQEFFKINRNKFKSLGYQYTRSAGESNNFRLAMAAFNDDRNDDLLINHNISNQDIKNFRKKLIENVHKEITLSKKVIFSSEFFQSRLTKISEIERLKMILCELGFSEILVLVYLRKPSEIASSLYTTAVKSGSTLACPPPPDKGYFNNICDHQNTLKKWGDIFGKDNVIPRLFTSTDLKSGCIINDFMSFLKLQLDSDFIIPPQKNESISLLGVEILRRCNLKIPRFVNGKVNPLRSNIVHYFEKNFSDEKYQSSSTILQSYDEYFASSNEWVRRNYFPHKSVLFEKTVNEKLKEQVCYSSKDLDNISKFVSEIWLDKHHKITALEKNQI